MTFQQPALAFDLPGEMEFHQLRSCFIDEFARLEIAVCRRLKALEIPFDGRRGFDQLVGKLEKAKASCRLSKAGVEDLKKLPRDCEPLQHLRASLVHGVMEIATTRDQIFAIFRNAADLIDGSGNCYALTLDDFRQRTDELATLTKRTDEAR